MLNKEKMRKSNFALGHQPSLLAEARKVAEARSEHRLLISLLNAAKKQPSFSPSRRKASPFGSPTAK